MLSTTLCQQIWSLSKINSYQSWKEIDVMGSLQSFKTIKEFEAIIENISIKKIQGPDGLIGELYQHFKNRQSQSYMNSSRNIKIMNSPKFIFWGQCNRNTKIKQV